MSQNKQLDQIVLLYRFMALRGHFHMLICNLRVDLRALVFELISVEIVWEISRNIKNISR